MDTPVQLPHVKEHRQELLPGRLGRECRDPEPVRQNLPEQFSLWFYRNRRRTLQPHCQLLVQLHAGLRCEDCRWSRAGATGNCSASSATSATASIPRVRTPYNDDDDRGRHRRRLPRPARRQQGHHRPEGSVGPGCGPLWLFNHCRRNTASEWNHLSASRLLRFEHPGDESDPAPEPLLQLRRRLHRPRLDAERGRQRSATAPIPRTCRAAGPRR